MNNIGGLDSASCSTEANFDWVGILRRVCDISTEESEGGVQKQGLVVDLQSRRVDLTPGVVVRRQLSAKGY